MVLVEIKPEVQTQAKPRLLAGKYVYVQCQRVGNKPRLDIRICESKCQDKDTCRDYVDAQKHKTP